MRKAILLSFYIITSFLILAALSSCNGWKSYVVKAGKHSTNGLSLPRINLDRIEFNFRVNSTWYYPQQEYPGWSKIRGISHGHHQDNSSARLGYQCYDDSVLVVGAYCYVNGVSPQENPNQKGIIDTIQPDKIYHCVISRENDKYIIEFEDKKWECPAGEDKNWGYILNPYVGGEFTFDHDWLIEIEDLEK
jgi:hypothetical protein